MLSQVRQELSKREEEVTDLKELLEEAGNEFIAKDDELQSVARELKERDDQLTEQGRRILYINNFHLDLCQEQ